MMILVSFPPRSVDTHVIAPLILFPVTEKALLRPLGQVCLMKRYEPNRI